MTNEWLQRQAVIAVKAYPNPSVKYQESVCVAAITGEEGLIRLFPLNFRSLPQHQQFKKYQRVSLRITKQLKDGRPESYRPDEHSIKLLEEIGSGDFWRARWDVLRPIIGPSMCELIRRQESTGTSLGCVRPRIVEKFLVDDADQNWSASKKAVMQQIPLFDQVTKKLEKIPFVFRYQYRCEDAGCRGHCQSIIDWELMELYRKLRDQGLERKELLGKIEEKFFGDCCAPDRETYFFVGNHSVHRSSFMVLGVFWPPKDAQKRLF